MPHQQAVPGEVLDRRPQGGTGHAERRRAATDGMPVDAHAPHHLVLDLDQIAGIEEVTGGKERILDAARVRVEAAVASERLDLGGDGFGLGHAPLRGGPRDM